MAEPYKAVVIGAGQAGGPLARELNRAGWKTALIERLHMGGTCVNDGCTPTKTMVASARVAHLARRAADYGVRTGRISVDMERVRQRKRDIVRDFGGVPPTEADEDPGLEVIAGSARFVGPRSLEVRLVEGGARRLAADYVFVNTGTRPARPALPGLDDVPSLDSTSIMELDQVPRHLIVLGGGYVGLEFSQMFRRFGSRVTIVQRGPALLAHEDSDVALAIVEILRQDGIEVLLDTEAHAVEPARGEGIRLSVRSAGRTRKLSGSRLLVAVGRTPNTDDLDAAAGGIELDARGYVVVDEGLATTAPGVWAMGDVTGGPAFTHVSYDDYRILRMNLLGRGGATTAGRLVPYAVFLDPELGRVGLGEDAARKDGRKIRVAKMGMDAVARARERDETRGFMKVVVDAASEQILGCAVLGIEGGEIMSQIQLAMMGGVVWPRLRDAIFAHPTLAESLNNLFDEISD